jgi:hypothetical protein
MDAFVTDAVAFAYPRGTEGRVDNLTDSDTDNPMFFAKALSNEAEPSRPRSRFRRRQLLSDHRTAARRRYVRYTTTSNMRPRP